MNLPPAEPRPTGKQLHLERAERQADVLAAARRRSRSLPLAIFGGLAILIEIQYGLAMDRGQYWDFFSPDSVTWAMFLPAIAFVVLWAFMLVRAVVTGTGQVGYGWLALAMLLGTGFLGPIQASVGPAFVVGLGLAFIGVCSRDWLLCVAGAGLAALTALLNQQVMEGPRERFELRGYSTAGALESFDPWRLAVAGAGLFLVLLGIVARLAENRLLAENRVTATERGR